MGHDYFEAVTALDSARDQAVKKQAGMKVAEKPAASGKDEKSSHDKAVDDLEKEMSELHAKGRELMSAGKHNSPEYDALVVKNKHLRRKRDFLTDHGE